MNKLPDIAEDTKPEIKEYINSVGMEKVKAPIIFIDDNISYQAVASISMSTALHQNIRGVSMSEFLRYLNQYIKKPISIPNDISKILYDFHKISRHTELLKSIIRFEFDYMIMTQSPKSDNTFPQYHSAILQFELFKDSFRMYRGLTYQFMNYCPCSASLCEYSGSGIPHNQRAFCNLFVEYKNTLLFDDIINLIERCVINKPYPIIRRVDEQYIAEKGQNNTFFAEDIIRKIINNINKNDNIIDWYVNCTHEESIHQHNVVVNAYKGIDNGFNQFTSMYRDLENNR